MATNHIESRTATVDVIEHDDAGFVLSIGPTSIRLDRGGAQDVVAALTYALVATASGDLPESGGGAPSDDSN